MKLIIAIVRDSDNDPVINGLLAANYRVTQISSTGGLLRRGMSTLLLGLEDGQVEAAREIIKANLGPSTQSDSKRATLFVIDIEDFSQV